MLVGNPTPVRGHRTSLEAWKQFKIYAVANNLIAASKSTETNAVYTENVDLILAVAVYPQGDTARVAFGTDKGKLTILKLSADGVFEK
jgi:hypothetical protein